MPAPQHPKIYHIVHVDRLASIIADGHLWSDVIMAAKPNTGTMIGMSGIKARRMHELSLASHPGLRVGACVPFYFCPRSLMLFLIDRRNPELAYQGGQNPIVHLESDLLTAVGMGAGPTSSFGIHLFKRRFSLLPGLVRSCRPRRNQLGSRGGASVVQRERRKTGRIPDRRALSMGPGRTNRCKRIGCSPADRRRDGGLGPSPACRNPARLVLLRAADDRIQHRRHSQGGR